MDNNNKNLDNDFLGLIEQCSQAIDSNQGAMKEKLAQTVLQHTSYSEAEVRQKVDTIFKTIELTEEMQKDLSKARENGISREDWLLNIAQQSAALMPDGDAKEILLNVNQSLKSVGANVLELEAPLDAIENETVFNNALTDSIINGLNSGISSDIQIFKAIPKIDIAKEIEAFQEYYDSPLGDESEGKFKKTMATAAVIARDSGLFPEKYNSIGDKELTHAVNQGMEFSKVLYQVGNGTVSPLEGLEHLSDVKTATVGSVIVDYCREGGAKVGEYVGSAIGSIFGPVGAAIGGVIGNVVGGIVGEKVGGFIVDALGSIADVAVGIGGFVSDVVSGIGDFVSDVFSDIGDFIDDLFW